MPEPAYPFEDDFKEESSRLYEGLKSCRSLMNDYRVILTVDQPPSFEQSDEQQPEK